jgi:hypothetical protein
MRKLISGLFVMFLLAGCATTANYQQKLTQWQGAPAQQLINAWGYPDTSIKLPNGNIAYMYLRQQLYSTPVYPAPTFSVTGAPVYSMGFYNYPVAAQTVSLYCRTWFEINRQNVIVNTRFEGNNCVAGR